MTDNHMGIEIQERRDIWVAWTNTDCTEGRGRQIPKAVCESKATAIRLGAKGYVQGGNCPITQEVAVKVNGGWLVPGTIIISTDNDKEAQKRIDEKLVAIEKAKAAGLTDADLKLLTQ